MSHHNLDRAALSVGQLAMATHMTDRAAAAEPLSDTLIPGDREQSDSQSMTALGWKPASAMPIATAWCEKVDVRNPPET
jgi:hypothetical protein